MKNGENSLPPVLYKKVLKNKFDLPVEMNINARKGVGVNSHPNKTVTRVHTIHYTLLLTTIIFGLWQPDCHADFSV